MFGTQVWASRTMNQMLTYICQSIDLTSWTHMIVWLRTAPTGFLEEEAEELHTLKNQRNTRGEGKL